jgi:hypothetical protein
MCLSYKLAVPLLFFRIVSDSTQGPTPKNDFCRIFSRSKILSPLALVLDRVLDEEDEVSELIAGRIVNIFYLFSQAENYVKEVVADRVVLKRENSFLELRILC